MKTTTWIISALYVLCIIVILILSIIVASKSKIEPPAWHDNTADTTKTIVNSLEQLTIENDSMLNEVRAIHFEPIHTSDTIIQHDTMYIKIEEQNYKLDTIVNKDDTIHYEMNIQGYKLKLLNYKFNMITTNTDTITTIIQRKKDKRWSIGLQLGAGVGYYQKNFIVTPYIGLGVSYSLFSW